MTIDGKVFWMPKVVQAEMDAKASSKSPEHMSYVAEYGNYRKFVTGSSITFEK